MGAIRVVTDSSCDLPEALVADAGIEVVPLTIRFGEEELVDRADLTPGEFWARCAGATVLPETAAPSPGAFEQAFRGHAAAGADGVVCINISSKLSATIQAAQAAANAVGSDFPVRVVDSQSVSLGLGLICLEAARMGADGSTLDEVVARAEDLASRTRIYAALDTLEHLKKGGRIGGARAMVGSLLSIKPVIEVRDGLVEDTGTKQRTRARSLQFLVDKVAGASPERVAVVHGEAPDIDAFLDQVGAVFPRDQIVVGDLGPVVGTHAGPRTVGVILQVRPAETG